ncbi:glucose-1-phosphate adenylyltransferase [Athalassotoga saccharophila]|uniref:glucose-1-phosphate adenylyltransferase n=1 Tax=Athalassotoga saccharophila TaxID=1441386 RepID=UPI001379B5C4|nr:glucose-1-phosphate adenylyltransferase [Athalassotoga saccharophila]BBJ28349.1 glucose-1-phosphate adenylyltransferase [Athalassotoga saccharophila]
MNEIIAMILAGGQGTRLGVLTENVVKPAVPFGGKYRIIDFTLSNCVNSSIYTVGVLTQYRPRVLSTHLGVGRDWDMDRKNGGLFILSPYAASTEGEWYKGTAHAVAQNIDFIDQFSPKYVLILSGDHVYSMDYNEMLDFHISKNADATISCIRVPLSEAHRFGTVITDNISRVKEFEEKPKRPRSQLASMGIYIFNWPLLREILIKDSRDENSSHDFGKDIMPNLVSQKAIYAYEFEGYWRDVGTIDAFWEANIDLTRSMPALNLYDPNWRFYTHSAEMPPAFFGKEAKILNSLTSEGCIVNGTAESSVLFQGVILGRGSYVKNSVVMTNVKIGENCVIENAIISENVVVGNNCQIGIGENIPNEKYPNIYNSGISVIGEYVIVGDDVRIGKNASIGNFLNMEEMKVKEVPGGKNLRVDGLA